MTISIFDDDSVEIVESQALVTVPDISETLDVDQPLDSLEVDDGWNVPGLDYRGLANKPAVEGNLLVGDKRFSDLGLKPLSNVEIKKLIEGKL